MTFNESIDVAGPLTPLDAILLDDDPLIREAWKLSAERAGKRLAVFSTLGDLLASPLRTNFAAAVYVDFHLGDTNGSEAARELYAQGFRDIRLTTGSPPHNLGQTPWLREVVGKAPPWRK